MAGPSRSQSSLSLSFQKCSHNRTTAAEKSHKPNHLRFVESSSSTSSGWEATVLRRPRTHHPSPLRRPYESAAQAFVLVSTRRGGEGDRERPGVAEQEEGDVSSLLTSSSLSAASVPRALSATYYQQTQRYGSQPPRWRFLGRLLLCACRQTVEAALEHSESSRSASLQLDPGGKAVKLSEDLPQTHQILRLSLQEGSLQHDQGEEVDQLQQDYKLLASRCHHQTEPAGIHLGMTACGPSDQEELSSH
nr:unnamed protein product [Digitaria exilis]